MSLIPSESYSFPDHFTTTVVPSRKPKAQAEPVPVESPRKNPSIVPLPDPKPQPTASPPNPALRRANAPPPRIPETPPSRRMPLSPSLKPKGRWNQRAPAMDPAPFSEDGLEPVHYTMPALPAGNVIPMRPAQPEAASNDTAPPQAEVIHYAIPAAPIKPVAPRTPVQPQAVRPTPRAVAVSNPQTDFFQLFAQGDETTLSKRRRKMKFRRFVTCECAALAVLLPLAIVGLSHRPTDVALLWTMNILTIASAAAAALIPILFYASTPTLPEIER